MSEGKKRLSELEKTGKYFFHGSGNEVEVFEPRQSHNYIKGEKIKDGDPSVSASPAIDYAIFMAIFSQRNMPKNFTSMVDINTESEDSEKFELTFSATKESLDQLKDNASGWVYVFNREDFPIKKSVAEYRSSVHVTPLEKVIVNREDLPEVSELIL